MKKPKKKELVELEKLLKYYHRKGNLEADFRKEIVTRKEAEKRGYRMCPSGCF
ncbi:hypothetical protein LCGC14_1742150 [marine sediment metagenome]|uniref:Uncharacterized protein n=2 Tax=marine sediment metagenome TaxID=412755 RepID=A0A0F9HTY0_9ZZZZ